MTVIKRKGLIFRLSCWSITRNTRAIRPGGSISIVLSVMKLAASLRSSPGKSDEEMRSKRKGGPVFMWLPSARYLLVVVELANIPTKDGWRHFTRCLSVGLHELQPLSTTAPVVLSFGIQCSWALENAVHKGPSPCLHQPKAGNIK